MRRLLPLALLPILFVAAHAGETLPPGPPWTTDWLVAKQEALSTGRPIFAYFTKKH